jgi:hypothetical protein
MLFKVIVSYKCKGLVTGTPLTVGTILDVYAVITGSSGAGCFICHNGMLRNFETIPSHACSPLLPDSDINHGGTHDKPAV